MFASMVMAAALFFTVGGIFMKLSEGLTKFWPTVIVFALFVGTALQTLAMKREDLAVTYLWVVGLESILAFAFGVLLFSESCTPARIAGVVLIAGGIISLRSAYSTRLGSAAARSGGRRPRLRGPRSLKPPATCAALRGSRCRPAATGRAARRQG